MNRARAVSPGHIFSSPRTRLLSVSFVRQISSSSSKEKIVVLGCGWGGFRVAKDLDKAKYEVTVVSPRNHFLFTPLLPSTTVGTLEFRCVQEPIRTIKNVKYLQAVANKIDFSSKKVQCYSAFV